MTHADDTETINGAGLFADNCLTCHALPGPWPDVIGLSKLTGEEVYRVLSAGLMRELAHGLNDSEKKAIATYVGNLNPEKPSLSSGGLCSAHDIKKTGQGMSWSGWSADNTNDRYVRDIAIDRSRLSGLKLKWAFVFPDTAPFTSAGNQATVANGRLYIGNMNGMVYALDAESGCTLWSFKAKTHIRSSIVMSKDTLVFADYETNVYALNANNGALLWQSRADEQPSARVNGNVTLHKGVVYVPISSNQEFTVSWRPETSCCSFQGSVVAFDVESGDSIWKTSLIDEPLTVIGTNSAGLKRYGPSGVAVWSIPTVDDKRQLLYITTGNQYTEPRVDSTDAIVALDLTSGSKKWAKSFVPDEFEQGDIWHSGCEATTMFSNATENCPPLNSDNEGDREIGAPAVLKTLANGKQVLLVATKDGILYALNPDKEGDVLWQIRLSKIEAGRGPILGGIEHGIALDDKHAYVPVADMSPLQQTAYGSMSSVNLESGKLKWQVMAAADTCDNKPVSCNNGYMGAPTLAGDILFAGSTDGHLRAFDINSGKIIWSYDTVREFSGVNGLTGSGGSIARNGPTIVNGMMYQTSGYGHLAAGMPGNVLLAFEIPLK